MSKQKKPLTFNSFVFLANFFFKTNGMYAYDKLEGGKQKSSWWDIIVFYSCFINMNIVLLGEVLYVINSFVKGENFVEATMTLSYIGFVLVGETKMCASLWKKPQLTEFIRELYGIFPLTVDKQEQYEMRRYWKQSVFFTVGFSVLLCAALWTYNLFSIMSWLIYDVLLKSRVVEQQLPYYMLIPFDWHDNWTYYLLYALQDYAGYTSSAGIISTDLLLCSVATQMIMHYDHVARSIMGYEVQAKGIVLQEDPMQVRIEEQRREKDLEFIGGIVEYHDKILRLSDKMNDVFGIPLLLNFLTSSFMICFVGFQMTIGTTTTEMRFKWFFFLIASTTQVYLICHYGQMLIDASTGIAAAVYNHNWYNADVRYKKMLVLIAERAQKPAILKATAFVTVSRTTMTDIMQMSYKFFAVLRQMYSN